MGALSWEFSREKQTTTGAPNSKCTAPLEFKRLFTKQLVFCIINNAENPKIYHLGVSSHGNECPGATWGESSHGNEYPEGTWDKNAGSFRLNGRFLQSSTPEILFVLELWTESNGWEIRKLFFNAVSKPSQIKLKSCSNLTVLIKS